MSGKRAGARRTTEPSPASSEGGSGLAGPALGITLALVAWGYLVYAAIEFGSAARAGDSDGWMMLGLATLGAAACLFVGLMMISRLTAVLGAGGSRQGRSEARRGPATGGEGRSGQGQGQDPEIDTAGWTHTRPQQSGTRRSIVPSVGGNGPTTPSSPDPRNPAPPAPAAARAPGARAASNGRPAGSRASRQVRAPRRDRPQGGRRAAR